MSREESGTGRRPARLDEAERTSKCEAFSARLIEFRRRRRWTQSDLGRRMAVEARQVGRPIPPVAKSTISSYETGKRSPDTFYALLLCRALEGHPEELALEDVLDTERLRLLSLSTAPPEPPGPPRSASAPAAVGAVDWSLAYLPLVLDRWSGPLAPRPLDPRTLADLRRLTALYRSQRRLLSAAVLLPAVSTHLAVLRHRYLLAGCQADRQELASLADDMAAVAEELWQSLTDRNDGPRTDDVPG